MENKTTVEDRELQDIYFIQKKISNLIKKYQKDFMNKEVENKDQEILKMLEKIQSDVEKHIYNDKNDPLYHYKHYFITIIKDLKEEKEFNRNQIKPIKLNLRPYNEKVYSKLNYLFRKKQLTSEEIEEQYTRNVDNVNEQYNLFIDLIDWLNDNGFSIVAEKTLFCAFLGINVDVYNELLKNGDNEIRTLFKNIDDYFTTSQFGSLIATDRSSLERIQKTEKYGQEMRQTQPDSLTFVQNNTLSYNDIMREVLAQGKTAGVLPNRDNVIDTKVEK